MSMSKGGRGGLAVAFIAAVVAALAAAAEPAAAATQRYASPTGTGDCSTPATACDIETAITGAGSGDEVILAPGDYGSPTPISAVLATPAPNIFVHGLHGQPPPRIHFDGGGYLNLSQAGTRASYLKMDGTIGPLDVGLGAEADEINAHGTGSPNGACAVYGTLKDSICWASGSNAFGLEAVIGNITPSLTLRNVTLIASGSGGIGLKLRATGGGTLTANATNLIASGASLTDIAVSTDGASTATLNIDHSNYMTATPSGTGASVISTNQQTQAPLFLDASGGDFREASGSPTIDAGLNDPANGDFDFEGDPRISNGATDIGADEFELPPVLTPTPDSFAGVILGKQVVRVKHGKAAVSVGCPAGTPPLCAGTLTLTYTHGRKTVKLGSAPFAISPGTSAKLRVKLSRLALRLLASRGRLNTQATATATDGAGTPRTVNGAVKLKA